MKRSLLFLLALPAWAVPQQVTFTVGAYYSVNVSGSAFSSLTQWRVEGRVTSTANYPGTQFTHQLIWSNASGNTDIFIDHNFISTDIYQLWVQNATGGTVHVNLPTSGDFVFRVTRLATSLTAEVWSVNGSNYASGDSPLTVSSPTSGVGTVAMGDGVYTTGPIGFIRWFSTVLPIGSQPPGGGPAGDLMDLEFSGNLQDLSSNHNNLTGSGGVSYSPAPVYSPACVMTAQQTFRAGYPFQLTSGSFGLNNTNTPVSQTWQQVPGNYTVTPPSTLSWVGQNTATPTVSGATAGSYTIQLTVTDSTGLSSSCTTKYGFVATDSNGSVIVTNPTHQTILGPMIAAQNDPWPAYESEATQFANLMIQKLAGTSPYQFQFVDYWNQPGPGTIAVTNGSASVVGTGTTFTTTFCMGNEGSPTTAKPNSPGVVVWYPMSSLSPYAGTGITGRLLMQVSACIDDTHLTTAVPYSVVGNVSAGSGLQYAYVDNGYVQGTTTVANTISAGLQTVTPASMANIAANYYLQVDTGSSQELVFVTSTTAATFTANFQKPHPTTPISIVSGPGGIGGWETGNYPGNYYDDVKALYAQWYRTGIDDYLQAARHLADAWFSFPTNSSTINGHDKSTGADGFHNFWPYRSMAVTGLYMRNADNPPFDYSPGLAWISDYLIQDHGQFGPSDCRRVGPNVNGCGYDVREQSYALEAVDFCAMFLTGSQPAQAAACAQAAALDMQYRWSSSLGACPVAVAGCGVWYMNNAWAAPYNPGPGAGGAVNLTQGSSYVTFSNVFPAASWIANNCSGGITCPIAFYDEHTVDSTQQMKPPSNSYYDFVAGLPVWYFANVVLANTSTSSVISSGTQTVTPGSMSYIVPGVTLTIDTGGNQESVLVTAVTATAFTAVFAKAHNTTPVAIAGTTSNTVRLYSDINGTIPVNYAGSFSGSNFGFAISNLLGWGSQLFMVGIQNQAFYFTSLALQSAAASGVSGASTYAVNAVSYIQLNLGFVTAYGISGPGSGGADQTNGGYYGAGYINCGPYPNSDPANCYSDRLLNLEILNVATAANIVAPTSRSLALGNLLMNSMWATSGMPGYDGFNLLNPSYLPFFYTVNSEHKWFGFCCGVGAGWSWPSAMLGGLRPPIPRIIHLSLDFQHATQALLTVVQPDGTSSQVTCTSSPCAVTVDAREGDHLLFIEYRNPANQVLIPKQQMILNDRQ